MSNFKSDRKDSFLAGIATTSIHGVDDELTKKCKFNFAYFHSHASGQSFDEWNHTQLSKLLNKLAEYCKFPLQHWEKQKVGSSGNILAIYGKFPKKSAFEHPKHVPHEAQWARFRLESAVRLVGFVLPHECSDREHPTTKCRFDINTFYVVFLDAHHQFYKTEKA
jgi:hypothetical protein